MPSYIPPRHRYFREETKAAFFGVFMLSLITASVVMAMSEGPIILGTEMNTNGMVEYLCLGDGCEHLQPMDW